MRDEVDDGLFIYYLNKKDSVLTFILQFAQIYKLDIKDFLFELKEKICVLKHLWKLQNEVFEKFEKYEILQLLIDCGLNKEELQKKGISTN